MTQYVTIVLAIKDMTKFDVEFKSEIHDGKVVAMAKYDALAVADMARRALFVCVDEGACDGSVVQEIDNVIAGRA